MNIELPLASLSHQILRNYLENQRVGTLVLLETQQNMALFFLHPEPWWGEPMTLDPTQGMERLTRGYKASL